MVFLACDGQGCRCGCRHHQHRSLLVDRQKKREAWGEGPTAIECDTPTAIGEGGDGAEERAGGRDSDVGGEEDRYGGVWRAGGVEGAQDQGECAECAESGVSC